ncbi:MAG: hypothetical protein ACO3DQ_10415 [Cephaloticoccus sp.]
MANEITLASGLTASKGGLNVSPATTSKTLDMSGANMNDGSTAAVTGSYTSIEMGSLTTGADYWVHLYNLDSTNFCLVSLDASTTHGKIPPGAFWGPVKIPSGVTVSVKADTAALTVGTVVCAA